MRFRGPSRDLSFQNHVDEVQAGVEIRAPSSSEEDLGDDDEAAEGTAAPPADPTPTAATPAPAPAPTPAPTPVISAAPIVAAVPSEPVALPGSLETPLPQTWPCGFRQGWG